MKHSQDMSKTTVNNFKQMNAQTKTTKRKQNHKVESITESKKLEAVESNE